MGGWTSALRSAGLEPPAPGKSERYRMAVARRREAAVGRPAPIPARLRSPDVVARITALGFDDVESYLRARYLDQCWSPALIASELGVPPSSGRGPIQLGLDAFGIPRRGRREAQLAIASRV